MITACYLMMPVTDLWIPVEKKKSVFYIYRASTNGQSYFDIQQIICQKVINW
jgi:hypothetical protein